MSQYVKDLKKTKEFFEKYFSAKSNDMYHNKTMTRTDYIHLAFSVGSKELVDELTKQIKKDGYEVISEPRTTGDGYYESCIVGIEGNQIEITV